MDKCRKSGIKVPIIPGLKPITTKKQVTILPKTFYIDIPHDLIQEIEKCDSDKQVKEVGIEWCIKQSKELISKGAPVLHFYTMGNSDVIRRIASSVF